MPFTLFDTELGTCGVAWTGSGLLAVQLPEATAEEARARLAQRSGETEEDGTARPAWVDGLVGDLTAHLSGSPRDLSRVPLAPARTGPFAARVYAALREVPPGHTTTYGALARAAGSAGAARAVGRAMASNPWPVVVPCHRVVGASTRARDGAPLHAPGGFSAYGGLATKQRLLALEGVRLGPAQRSLFAGASTLPFDAARAVEALTGADPVLGKHMAKVGPLGLTLKDSEDTFAALAESIVYQQLSGKAAAAIFGRLRAVYPRGVLEPRRVLTTEDDVLRAAGLSRGKLESLRDLAARSLAGDVPPLAELARMDDEAVIERLTRVRGVGRWTAEMLLIFRLGRPDVLPVADLGVRKGFARVFPRARRGDDELPSAEEVAKRAVRWRPYRSVASWYLWRALDAP